MKHLFLFETFIEFEKERQSKKETPKNTHLIYSDEEMTIKVVKTLDSSRAVSDPQWCSSSSEGFYRHNLTSNMYRFTFKDGYKLRLTWDYYSESEGNPRSTWGQGGVMPNGERAQYFVISPNNINDPFKFNYKKNDYRQYMVDKIGQIPKEAIDAVYEYQQKHSMEKSALYRGMYKEIEKIRIIGVEKSKSSTVPVDDRNDFYDINAKYNGRIYKFKMTSGFRLWALGSEFRKDFKNKYALSEIFTLEKYIIDKTIEWIKSNNKELYLQIRTNKVKDIDTEDSPF